MNANVNLVGTTLGQYEVRDVLRAGQITDTYYGYQPSLKRTVAIQTLVTGLRLHDDYNKALLRGAELIAEFEHPNIVPVLDCGQENGITYVVMRLMTGGTLEQRLQNEPLTLRDAALAVRQIGGALEYVHSLGRVHGDPATANIVFDQWGSAYVANFILAGFLQTLSSGIMGVPNYMAPERWREEAPTPFTDQYALAAIAYHMIAGQPPHDADTLGNMLYKHLNDAPPDPQDYRPDIPTAVNAVLRRGLAKAPADRYSTVMDFARDFEKALSSPPAHLFISYSRRDTEYARELRQHLQKNSFNIWIDDRIEHGDQWFNQIHEAIKTCAAFLVVMTPDAEQSEWVQKEILLAKRYKKPIFPLLRVGEEFALLIDIQFADVRDGSQPNTEFHRRVSRVVYGNN